MEPVRWLVAEAAALGGGNLCASGHDWFAEGGRACPVSGHPSCSQPVFRCARCGEYDYGYDGGPGAAHCTKHCKGCE